MTTAKKHAGTKHVRALDPQTRLFAVFLTVIGVLLLWKLWPIRGIYLDPETRVAAETTLVRLQNERGWLLSDMQLKSAALDAIVIEHRPHRRGADDSHCFKAMTDSSNIVRCADAR